ncbi:MAG: hypothetical protein H0X01_01040 [Nitrospira sp.]|nr:hypothetical protein [Nitrospira sp.]
MPKFCWCCGKPLHDFCERFDGVCPDCGIEDTPMLEITGIGRLVADACRALEFLVAAVLDEPEPEPLEPVW